MSGHWISVAWTTQAVATTTPSCSSASRASGSSSPTTTTSQLGDEALGNLALPYLTGQVAVAQLVANSVWLLLGHEDQGARLAADPALLGGALGETLRYLPPASLATRIALEPIMLRGHRIEAGHTLQLSLAAANRDPRRFPDPDRFDIARW